LDKSKLLVTADGFFGGCSDFGCWRESGKIDGLCSGIMLSVRCNAKRRSRRSRFSARRGALKVLGEALKRAQACSVNVQRSLSSDVSPRKWKLMYEVAQPPDPAFVCASAEKQARAAEEKKKTRAGADEERRGADESSGGGARGDGARVDAGTPPRQVNDTFLLR
jgi:hypothetical protein